MVGLREGKNPRNSVEQRRGGANDTTHSGDWTIWRSPWHREKSREKPDWRFQTGSFNKFNELNELDVLTGQGFVDGSGRLHPT
jgi:hypothetical protein